MSNDRIGLGKGLSAILGEMDDEAPISSVNKSQGIDYIDVSDLQPGKFQPRHLFKVEELADLIASVKEKGVLQPLLVRPVVSGGYEIIAGERRWRAAKEAGLLQVPVIIKDFSDKETLEVALIENLQRQDLNPLEEALAYTRLMEEFHHTQEGLSQVVGKSRSYVANMMRLLDLPDVVKEHLEKGEISTGHARALLNAKNPEKLVKKIIEQGLSVRQTEHLCATEGEKKTRSASSYSSSKGDSDIMAVEAELSAILKTSVSIRWNGKSGKIIIDCYNTEALDSLLHRLTMGGPAD